MPSTDVGYSNFHIYILEVCSKYITKLDLTLRENYWYNLIKPTYNIQDILKPLLHRGSNHYLFGKLFLIQHEKKLVIL
jgi:hypothetical protein